MSTTHTPGPWAFRLNSASDETTACIEIIQPRLNIGEYRGTIAHLQSCEHINGITRAEATANARLIAALPELLAALEQAHMALIGYLPGHRNAITTAAIDGARAALDKAVGEQS